MTESIKQEIINNIFENGDKLITGPILQTVLIDMIDDVNVKDQAILSKTGSWDEAVTQIPNLATKEEVTNLSESVARDLENVVGGDLTGYATEQWVQSQGYLTEHQDISGLATKTELNTAKDNLQGNITSLSESVARDLANVSVPEGVATEAWVQSQGYLTEHQDISGLATKTEVTNLSESVARDLANVPEGVATEAWVQSQDYASKSYVDNAVSSSSVDLTGYATETWVQNQGYLKEHQDISGLATKTELTSVSQSVQTDITNLSESVANSAVWKKGTGTDSIVQILSGDKEANTPTATRLGAVAIGTATTASGYYSHAEGSNTIASGWGSHAEGTNTLASGEYSHAEGNHTTASGNFGSHAEGFRANASGQISHAEGSFTEASGHYSHAEGEQTEATGEASHAEGEFTVASGSYSHAEGNYTKASGWSSHAEGGYTLTSNQYEHAQGQYNYTSSNQIFSVGAGEMVNYNITRRNAVSILAVPNVDTKINTASFFVQNIGGYDGTNPEPGTNDLATVINNLPSGGSSETLWKKGTGEDSIVQKLTGANEANTPSATGVGALALGFATTASGNNSHAEGQTTVASGLASHAEGNNTIASAHCSHAEGGDTKASGSYSHAEGIYTVALGQASHTEGFRTTASKEGSHAEGESTIASGSYSHAEGGYTTTSNQYEHAQGQYNHNSTNQIFSIGAGEKIGETVTRRNAVSILEVPNSDTQVVTASFFVQNIGGYDGTNPEPGTNDLATVINNLPSGGGSSETLWKKGTGTDSIVQVTTGLSHYEPKATGTGSIATGYNTEASGDNSHAEGNGTKASGDNSHAEGGYVVASGSYSHAEGQSTKALGNFGSHAEGRDTTASGYGSHAEGQSTVASGNYSHAEGSYTIASGYYSHAEGSYTTASGFYSHAEGESTIASGFGSHAKGTGSKASGQYSHAEGGYTKASNEYEHAQGRYNHNSENQIFSIGTGNSDTDRRNAVSVLEVDNSGSYTSSFFVQNIGGYDGTNPEPGTNDLATVINGLSSSGGSSGGGSSETLWKKGTGTDSIVQVLSGDNETNTPRATGTGSVATGYDTGASKNYSHAEGWMTAASGEASHAEGSHTQAIGFASHAEGWGSVASGGSSHAEGEGTIAENEYEHAQGTYNHNSENQIFSVGAGENMRGITTRRNAVSILAVPNSDTQILTSSFFVQNIGGYDGTNPIPGTNDLATVLNNTETWTFTLEDGSTVTKTIVMR